MEDAVDAHEQEKNAQIESGAVGLIVHFLQRVNVNFPQKPVRLRFFAAVQCA